MRLSLAAVVLTALHATAAPVDDLFERVLGERSREFVGSVVPSADGTDYFTILAKRDEHDRQVIQGSTVGSIASGLNHYLANVTKVQIRTWSGSNLDIPHNTPRVAEDIKVTRSYKWGYYQNVCTVSYTMAWWAWERWEQELDWMAMNGINMPLAFTGQEYVWEQTFAEFGLTYDDLTPFFSGPAFFAWQRMGNLKGWGGPLPEDFIVARKDLQMRLLRRMEELDMTPVLPAFAGHIPEALTLKYPNITFTRSADWNGFSKQYGSVFYLDATDPMFVQIGKTFVQKYHQTYNTTSKFYNADQYNEMNPASNNDTFLVAAGKAMYDSLVGGDPDAIWVMQGWLFVDAPKFWTSEKAKAYLSAIPNDHMLILDLNSEDRPQFQRFESYYGKPFIWNMLHNYGGNTGLYGEFDNINEAPQKDDLKQTSITGFGITMEGTLQNYAVYELMLQNIWRQTPHENMTVWLHEYSVRRYGGVHEGSLRAWELLYKTVYSAHAAQQYGVTKNIITLRPAMNLNHTGFMPTNVFYDPAEVQQALKALLSSSDAFSHQETYQNDLVDVTRQTLSNLLSVLNINHTAAYNDKNEAIREETAKMMIEVIHDLDRLLGSCKFFLLGRWIDDARKWGGDNTTKQDYYEWNARNQVTLWGPKGEVKDYAAKEWGGLVEAYYLPRWSLYFSTVKTAVAAGKEFNETAFRAASVTLEESWQHKTDRFPTEPTGNTTEIIHEIVSKYFPHL